MPFHRFRGMAYGSVMLLVLAYCFVHGNPPCEPCSKRGPVCMAALVLIGLPANKPFPALGSGKWCRRLGSNQRPRAYESPTLPLSYVGTASSATCAATEILPQPAPRCQALRSVRTVATIAGPGVSNPGASDGARYTWTDERSRAPVRRWSTPRRTLCARRRGPVRPVRAGHANTMGDGRARRCRTTGRGGRCDSPLARVAASPRRVRWSGWANY